MARNKVTLAYIRNDSERKASYKKRKEGLLKKVEELRVLCEIDACAIIYSPYDRQPVVYPSNEGARATLARFRSLSEMDQNRRMYTQDRFNRERTQKSQEKLLRLLKVNKRKLMKLFLVRLMKGKVRPLDFDLADYALMKQVIQDFHGDLRAMSQKNRNGQNQVLPPPPGPLDNFALPTPPPPGPLHNYNPPPPPPPVDPNYQFPLGTEAITMPTNFMPTDFQFQNNLFPEYSMVPFAQQYIPGPIPPVPVMAPENNVGAPVGGGDTGDENWEDSFPWHLLESATAVEGGILDWDEGTVMPPYPNFADFNNVNDNYTTDNHNSTFTNPSASDPITGSVVIANPSFNQQSYYGAPGSGFDPNATGFAMSPMPSFNPSGSYVPPGFGFDPDSSFSKFTFMPTPSVSQVAPGSGNNI